MDIVLIFVIVSVLLIICGGYLLSKRLSKESTKNILFETEKLIIEYSFEEAYLIEKKSRKELMHACFYGDASCGLIDVNNDWAVIAGDYLSIWRKDKKVQCIEGEYLGDIRDIRVKNERIIEILTDPWSENSAIWELDIATLKYHKVRDFDKYIDSEYTDNIDW